MATVRIDTNRTLESERIVLAGGGRANAANPAAPQLWDLVSGRTSDIGEFCRAWLALQCGAIAGSTAGLLLSRQQRQDSGAPPYVTAAAWPDAGRDLNHLTEIAMHAAEQRRSVATSLRNEGGVVLQHAAPSTIVAHPIGLTADLPFAVVAVAVAPRGSGADPQLVARQLHWGSGWLEMVMSRQHAHSSAQRVALAASGMDLLALVGEHKHLPPAAMAAANDLAHRLKCARVSIGLVNRRRTGINLQAVSRSVLPERKAQLGGLIENAMEEALDQGGAVAYPPLAATERQITVAHKELAKTAAGRASLLSVLISSRGRPLGVITLERHRDQPFSSTELQLCEAIAVLVGPLFDLQCEASRWLTGRALDAAADGMRALFGPRHSGLKFCAAVFALLATVVVFANGELRVSAKTFTEGIVQRAAVAPFEGFIKRAAVRPGDTVHEGDVLAALDDKDLVLDELRQASELEKLSQKYRDALAKHDRSEMVVLAAQVAQAEAQLTLAKDKVARAQVTAPFDGVVVAGDLSQMLGSPVEKGKVLFEIAPLNDYRIILQVDERDIRYVQVDQTGTLALTGLPEQTIPFHVATVMPVATSEDGHNFFRVEARLEQEATQLRPGMEGIAKIDAGQGRLIWVWTHPLVDWLRLALWKYMP
jgi:multidrug efflux pump subunit AcrA (membrane-fusion protein)